MDVVFLARVLALTCFVMASFGVSAYVNLTALGLAFLTLSLLLA